MFLAALNSAFFYLTNLYWATLALMLALFYLILLETKMILY